MLARPEFRPRALFDRFNLEILATTDSPLSDLADHLSIIESGWPGVVVPTFRPDALVHLHHPDWLDGVDRAGSGLRGLDGDVRRLHRGARAAPGHFRPAWVRGRPTTAI